MKTRTLVVGAALAAVLLLNNLVLKAVFPGFVTGKLSDLAGCGLMALWLGYVLGQARAPAPRVLGAVAAAAYLAWIKLSPAGCAFHVGLVNGWLTLTARAPGYELARDATDVACAVAAPLAVLAL